jgi:hypothetical protein
MGNGKWLILSSLCIMIISFLLAGCQSSPGKISSPDVAPTESVAETRADSAKEPLSLEERWGIKIEAIRLSAYDSMVDFRYRIIDPEKAGPLTDRSAKPYLVDEATGEKFYVPNAAKIGSLRAKGTPIAGRTYFILFSNGKGTIKKGSKVDVVIGDFKTAGLTVE